MFKEPTIRLYKGDLCDDITFKNSIAIDIETEAAASCSIIRLFI